MTTDDKVRSASSLLVAIETASVAMTQELEEETVITKTDENIGQILISYKSCDSHLVMFSFRAQVILSQIFHTRWHIS